MCFRNADEVAWCSIGKPLPTIARLVFSLAVLSGTTSAFALTTTDAVLAPNKLYGYVDAFIFQDSSLDANPPPPPLVNTSGFGMPPGFGMLLVQPNAPVNPTMYQYNLETYIDKDNPVFFHPGAAVETYQYNTRNNETFGYIYRQPVYVDGKITRDSEYYTSSEYLKEGGEITRLRYTWWYDPVDEDGQHQGKTGEFFEWTSPDSYRYGTGQFSILNNDPFDLVELDSKMQLDFPVSGYGIFDFENSFVYYEGESEAVSLAQIIAGDVDGDRLTYLYGVDSENVQIMWVSSRKVSGISLSYGLNDPNVPTIPEPETYAMLLAGLGVVGVAAKRRRWG